MYVVCQAIGLLPALILDLLDGGSLAGAETAFTVKDYGDIIYGGIASSGVTYARVGYPEWYYNIQKYAPRDCIKSIEANVDR